MLWVFALIFYYSWPWCKIYRLCRNSMVSISRIIGRRYRIRKSSGCLGCRYFFFNHDLWSKGCIFAELLTGQPLFPGDTDIDQLYRIMKCLGIFSLTFTPHYLGQLTPRHTEIFLRNPLFVGVRIPEIGKLTPLSVKLPNISHLALSWLQVSYLSQF